MNSNFMRHPQSNSVVNTDFDNIRAAKERKLKKLKEKEKQEFLEHEVTKLKDDISEIKNLLQQVLNGNNNS